VLKVRDSTGHTLYRHTPLRVPNVSRGCVEQLHRMLRAAVTHGTGRPAASGCASRPLPPDSDLPSAVQTASYYDPRQTWSLREKD